MSTKGRTDTRQVKHRFGKQSAKIACVAYNAAKALKFALIRKLFIARERLLKQKRPASNLAGREYLGCERQANM